ncbi:MAG TPA: CHAT domain-containing protein [Candidatus Angelobacter sp.]|nr:CHAT domain-containing protein [Candidatus Angelobacter sp.]
MWSWRFRILAAQVRLRQQLPREAVLLLASDPPANSPLDVSVRKNLVQGLALCGINNTNKDATAVLNQAEHIIPSAERGLAAELAFTRAMCSLSADRAAAQRYFTQAAEMAHGGDGFIEASSLLGVGYVLHQDDHYDEAITKFNEALNLTDSSFVKEKALGNIGFCHSQLGDWTRALPFSQEAEHLAGQIKYSSDQARWLIDVGREHFSQLEFPEADASYTKALSIAQAAKDRDGQAKALHHLTQLALKMRDLKKAEDYASQDEALHADGPRYLDLLQDKAEIAAARQDFVTAEKLLQEILHRPNVRLVFRWHAQSDLAAVYVAQKRFSDAEQAFRKAFVMVDEMRRTYPEELRISFLDEGPFYDQYVKFLVSQNKIAEALSIAERGRAPTLAEALGNGPSMQNDKHAFAPLQAVLKKRHQVALAYWLAEEESYLWAITPTGITLFHLRPEMEIKKQVEDYAFQIADRREIEESPAGGKLYDMLVGPAKELISKASSVIVVPHRSLYNLSFEALIVPAAKPNDKPHYWIEDVDVESASFLGLLAKPDPPRASRKDLLLMGAPVEASKDFPVLEHASEEMNKLAARFPAPGMAVIAGRDATPEAYASNHPGDFRLIHFVTHGTASTERPLDSAIILSPGPNKSYKLYARSIKDVKLHADLVTISACSGAGKRQYSGEGLVGLAWSFMRAGAHQVVAALWDVDDASSPQLMDDFYSELSKGKSVASALRHAKLNMLHSPDFHRRPFYWASLQLYTGG